MCHAARLTTVGAVGLLARNLQWCVTLGSLVLVGGVSWAASQWTESPWPWVAFAATSALFAQGLALFWVSARQRYARARILRDVRMMLQDVVNNQLVVIQMADQINRRRPGAVPASSVERSVNVIYEAISALSEQSLDAWSQKYDVTARAQRASLAEGEVPSSQVPRSDIRQIMRDELDTEPDVTLTKERPGK